MAEITIGQFEPFPTAQGYATNGTHVRGWYSRSYQDSDGVEVQGGNGSTGFYINTQCTIADGTITVPDMTVRTTVDANDANPQSIQLFLRLYSNGSPRDWLTGTGGTPSGWIVYNPDPSTSWTFAQLQLLNQTSYLAYPPQTYPTTQEMIDYVNSVIGTTSYASENNLGSTYLTRNPALSTRPLAVGDNDLRLPLLNALDYGVLNDGTAQSTSNLQTAITAAATQVNSISPHVGVLLPAGIYRFNSGSLIIPQGVSLIGVWTTTFGHTWIFDGATQPSALDGRGTTIEVDVGGGSTSGAFITAYANTTIKGISFYYVSQSRTVVTPTQYPPTIFLGQDSSHTHFDQCVEDCEFIGHWLAVKARYGGRWLLRNLRGYGVNGIDLDKMYDSSWIENPQFNSFWYSSRSSVAPADNFYKYTNQNGVAIKMGRVDDLHILNPFLLGYNKCFETVITSDEGSLPGGTAWATIVNGGTESSYYGAYLTGAQLQGVVFVDTRFSDTYDASGGGLGDGVVTTSTFDSNAVLQLLGCIYGGGGANTQNHNIVLSGGGQVTISGGNRFHNASVNSILVNSLVGNPANVTLTGNTFNTSTSTAVDITGYAKVSSSGNVFIQKNRSTAIATAGLGGYVPTSNGDRFLDYAANLGPVGANGTFIYETGEVFHPKNVELGNGVNAMAMDLQGVSGGATVGFGTLAVNALYNRDTAQWNRANVSAQSWLIIAESNEAGNGIFYIRRAAAGANPIVWTDALTISAAGAIGGSLSAATGLPISTGVSGLGTNVATFLATPSSANLAAALTDETGSGAAMFGTAPTVTTSLTMADAANIILNATTGTKLGTVGGASGQKLAFWGSVPVVQPVLATGAAHSVDDVIGFLQTIGLCRQS